MKKWKYRKIFLTKEPKPHVVEVDSAGDKMLEWFQRNWCKKANKLVDSPTLSRKCTSTQITEESLIFLKMSPSALEQFSHMAGHQWCRWMSRVQGLDLVAMNWNVCFHQLIVSSYSLIWLLSLEYWNSGVINHIWILILVFFINNSIIIYEEAVHRPMCCVML